MSVRSKMQTKFSVLETKQHMTPHRNSSLLPVDVRTSIFALQCRNNAVYILSTQNASLDLEHFRQGTGAPFCTDHPFESVLQITLAPEDPSETARVMAAEYRTQGKTVCNEAEMTGEELGAVMVLRRAPVLLQMHTYVLELQPLPGTDYPAMYVGKSQDLTKRWANHWASTAAKWTALHLPVRVVRVDLERGDSYEGSRTHEDQVTLEVMREHQRRHGDGAWASVRGGKYTDLYMNQPREL